MKTFSQYISENLGDASGELYHVQKATYELVQEYPREFRRLLRSALRGELDGEFRSKVQELANMMGTVGLRGKKIMEPDGEYDPRDNMNNVVKRPSADGGGGAASGGDGGD